MTKQRRYRRTAISLVIFFLNFNLSFATTNGEFIRRTDRIERNGWSLQDFLSKTSASIHITTTDGKEEIRTKTIPQGRVVDPDDILSSDGMDQLQTKIKIFESTPPASEFSMSLRKSNEDASEPSPVPIQLAIVLVRKMDLLELSGGASSSSISDEEWAAEMFATTLHDTWGVGFDSSQGGTGILILLSIEDRVMYISRGSAVARILTDTRVDRLIGNLRPLLRDGKYSMALRRSIDDITHFLEEGPPHGWEYWRDEVLIPVVLPFSIFPIIAGLAWCSLRREFNARRDYALVESQLSQLDRAQAEVLQGQYNTSSCPICFEDFKKVARTSAAEQDAASSETDAVEQLLGSDGLPLKLLRCGHVFDETCWAEWVSTGQGDVRKCPICKKDVGGTSASADTRAVARRNDGGVNRNNENERPPQPRPRNNDTMFPDNDRTYGQPVDTHGDNNDEAFHRFNDNNVNNDDYNNNQMVDNDHRRARALAQFHRERNFRLMRLAHRFPRYVGPQQIQRWTQSTFDGSLVRDPSFVRSNPRVIQEQRHYNHYGRSSMPGSTGGSGGFSSFGGGISSGGRGGRW